MNTTVIAHGYPSPVLETAKHDLNLVPLFIQDLVILAWLFPFPFGWNAGGNTPAEQYLAKQVCIVSAIRQKLPCLRQTIQKQFCSLVITRLTLCKNKSKRLAISIAKGMKLCVQSSPCASDAAGKSPFLRRLAAVR